MFVMRDYGNVRVVSDGSPFTNAYDIKVETLVDGEWKYYSGFNSLSDDYANTNAMDTARRVAKTLPVTV